jgi:hypothetical protein
LEWPLQSHSDPIWAQKNLWGKITVTLVLNMRKLVFSALPISELVCVRSGIQVLLSFYLFLL